MTLLDSEAIFEQVNEYPVWTWLLAGLGGSSTVGDLRRADTKVRPAMNLSVECFLVATESHSHTYCLSCIFSNDPIIPAKGGKGGGGECY